MDLMRALLRNPVAQYLAIGLLAVGVTLSVTETLAGQAARREALADARATTALLASGVAEPALPRGLVEGRIDAVDRFDRVVLGQMLTGGVVRLKIWRGDGTIVYSDDTRLLGRRFPLGAEEQEILRDGGTEAEVSDLTRPENRYEARNEGLVEVYTRIASPEGEPLLFETYYAADGIDARQAEVMAPFRRIIATALAVVIGVATAMLWVMTRRAKRAARERERLLRNAATASDAERRRIARDLHDGVVQDLAANAYALSTLARSVPDEKEAAELADIGSSLRSSMKSLRSLLVEIHPPDLTTSTLPAALTDLVAPVEAAGLAAHVEVGPLGDADPAALALVWRVAQEAVRNSLRHAGAGRVDVVVSAAPGRLELVVSDDGSGFDPQAVRAGGYGLRGLQSLAADSGADLAVASRPGEGTVVRLEIPT